jgi:DNA-binding PadR family transcriptional regulator
MKHDDPADLLPLPHLNYFVLLALADGDAHGWAVIKRIREMSVGRANPSSGSLYLAMVRMEDAGLIAEAKAPADADARRRYYRLTPFGRRVLAAESVRLAELVARAGRLKLLDQAGSARPGKGS